MNEILTNQNDTPTPSDAALQTAAQTPPPVSNSKLAIANEPNGAAPNIHHADRDHADATNHNLQPKPPSAAPAQSLKTIETTNCCHHNGASPEQPTTSGCVAPATNGPMPAATSGCNGCDAMIDLRAASSSSSSSSSTLPAPFKCHAEQQQQQPQQLQRACTIATTTIETTATVAVAANAHLKRQQSIDLDSSERKHQQHQQQQQRQEAAALADRGRHTPAPAGERPAPLIKKKFAQFEPQTLSSAPAPDVKIGQRVAYKEYYGNEFGTIRWIGRVPQISADWTVGVEFDNAIGEGDGSLHGRRYFIAKDCFAKFLPLSSVALVDQHVGRPEPGTMISVMSAAVRPGQMISIQRVSTVHVQHCFLNAPHRRPGAEFLAVNTRLHCQCPNCGPCAHVVKPPRTQRLRTHKNATHMCQFSTYTCCGMESSEDALCTYTGNKISSLPPPNSADNVGGGGGGARHSNFGLPPVGNSWMEGAGYLSQLQAERRKLMPEEYRLGAAPEDCGPPAGALQRHGSSKSGGGGGGGTRQRPFGHREGVSGRESLSVEAAAAAAAPPETGRHGARHRHRRRRHRHEHKDEPIYSNLQPNQHGQSYNPNSQTDENTTSLNQPSALPNWQIASFSHQPNNDELALVSLDKADDLANHYTHSHADEHADDAFGPRDGEPAKRFFYRDSIENRYLFPTDDLDEANAHAHATGSALNDAIDSTLEADLEDLSQARYGYFRPGGGRQRQARSSSPAGSRNLLVKSLRSLVSCLGASGSSKTLSDHEAELNSSNHHASALRNDDDDERRTLRIVCRRPLSGGATPINKSQPARLVGSTRSLASSCTSNSSSGSSSASTTSFIGSAATTSCSTTPGNSFPSGAHPRGHWQPRHAHRHQTHHARHFRQHEAAAAAAAQLQQHHYANWTQTRQFAELYESVGHNNELGGGGMSMAPAPLHAIELNQQQQQQQQHQVRRQVSSSSDCGFSSASQTSANFAPATPSAHLRHPQQLPEPEVAGGDDDEERRRLSAIYQRIAARLISSSSSQAPVTSEDLLRLKASLFELRAQSGSQPQARGCCASSQLECCEQLLAELLKKSCLQSQDGAQRPPPVATATPAATAATATKFENHQSKPSSELGAASGLPRAFELKLTLSINENGKAAERKTDGAGVCAPATLSAAAAAAQAPPINRPADAGGQQAARDSGDSGALAAESESESGGAQGGQRVNFSFVAPTSPTQTSAAS